VLSQYVPGLFTLRYSNISSSIKLGAAAALLTKPYILPDLIFIFGVAPFLTVRSISLPPNKFLTHAQVPLPIFIIFDWPRTRPWIYQAWLASAVWSWGFYNILFMHYCGTYGEPVHFPCGTRDFLVLF
jgi:osomolarity two-component system sensor histidine kinase SLN1